MKKNIINMTRLFGFLGASRFKLFLAAFFGILGHVAAFLIPVLGVYSALTQNVYLKSMIACAILRGLFRYIEQALNHEVAFRVLAEIRHTVFVALRKLVPGHFERYGYGNLMTLITSDIELLEVFFAHTISPILIALIFNGALIIYLQSLHILFALVALCAYVLIGIIFPLYFSNKGYSNGVKSRNKSSLINTLTLESVFGFTDITQYKMWNVKMDGLKKQQHTLNSLNDSLNRINEKNRFITDSTVLLSFVCILMIGSILHLDMTSTLLGATIVVSSFGPVIALSNLSSNLQHTFASATRVLKLLDTPPSMVPVTQGDACDYLSFDMIACDLGYHETPVLEAFSLHLDQRGIVGIKGASGKGKTTLFKTMMQLIPPLKGNILWSSHDIRRINTKTLRKEIGYMEQETTLFKDTIANNIRIGKWDATHDEISEAAKKANIHDFIMTLPQGYDTLINNSVSSGEKQRIGLARLFLHDASLWLLDEPTSNLDSLNEAEIMQTIETLKDEKAIVISSHRKSTLSIVDSKVDLDHISGTM
ncbi:hypothetical protein AOC36_03260 [Erysipelothrix larvae]|uniref:ABC transporter ATP-binding protein n=1 Tax=Erysipelothrix larvae TaxID=1514105 RepID=A0A0X8GZ47_9FIRM|nr:ABC transporter ATP-binding protein [Erysipelothrix larvae]AMC93034.1 hypothetical protein AOC36_03260 [Erysipelothrix larvae]